jgi:hypothetical protein
MSRVSLAHVSGLGWALLAVFAAALQHIDLDIIVHQCCTQPWPADTAMNADVKRACRSEPALL